MPRYRVYRIKDTQREHFRWSAHTGGLAVVKHKDYELGAEVEGSNPYSLWKELQDSTSSHNERPLLPGDLLETIEADGPGQLYITKYIGFEPARWYVPEFKPASTTVDEVSASPEKALQN